MLSFGEITYLQPSTEIEETYPKDQHPRTSQDQEADEGGQKFGLNLDRKTRQRSDKLLTTLLAAKLRDQE